VASPVEDVNADARRSRSEVATRVLGTLLHRGGRGTAAEADASAKSIGDQAVLRGVGMWRAAIR